MNEFTHEQPAAREHSVQTFVMRSGRMTQSQKRNYDEFSHKWCLGYQREVLDLQKIFGNTSDVIIEIGFGMGYATAVIAENNPDKNYIGIEVFKAGVGKLLGSISEKTLSNIRIIEHDAIEVLENMIADNSISAFHIFFPDPWQKKRHHKRRLVRRPRTDLLASKLKAGGYIYMVTDWEDYAEDALQELKLTSHLIPVYEEYAEPQLWRPKTKFEKKGLAKNHKIRELMFKKDGE